MDLAFLIPGVGAARSKMKIRDLMTRLLRAIPLAGVLALGLALSACDKCGDFFWEKPGSCKSEPAPN